MKKRVVPIETVETFLDLLHILCHGMNPQPNYDQLRDIFLTNSFEIECEDEEGEDHG